VAPRKDRYARYSEAGPDYVDNVQRLLRKFETAANDWCRSRWCARPAQKTRHGVIYLRLDQPGDERGL
jgi:2-oxoglutarate ferredoxin oxidoreductase subunit alpha